MKIKALLIAMVAMMATAITFTSCSDDDDANNYTVYQNAVDAQVKAGKKHNKAILLVAFGSTWQCAFKSFDNTKKAFEEKFTDADVYVSYSSAICINRAALGEGGEKRNYYAPNFWLHSLGAAKYDEIIIQSLQVIPGEEYGRVINYIKDFANNYLGDLDNEYLKRVTLRLGTPLLNNLDDVKAVAAVLNDEFGAEAATKTVAFMGHGNPSNEEFDYDIYKANVRYSELQEELQKYSLNYFVGTVDEEGNKKDDVLADITANAGVPASKEMVLQVLMSIAGDHAHNDMYGQGEEFWSEAEEFEDKSWYEYFLHNGYETISTHKLANGELAGLLDKPGILNVWLSHTENNIKLEDYYHSMFVDDEE